nr:hypothetical protein [Streptomyces sp. SHP 1-2]
MFADLGVLGGGEFAAGVGAEAGGVSAAGVVAGGGDVGLEVGGAQAFAGAVGEGGDAVGAQAEEGGDAGGWFAFDFGVPEDGLPAFGQGAEGFGDGLVVEGFGGGVAGGFGGVVGVPGVGEDGAALLAGDAEGAVADGADEVAAEEFGGAGAFAYGGEDVGERLGDQVVDVRFAGGVLPGAQGGGPAVACVQRFVGGAVALAGGGDEPGVAGLFGRFGLRRGERGVVAHESSTAAVRPWPAGHGAY